MRLHLSRPLAIDRSEALRYMRSTEDPSITEDLNAACDKILSLAAPVAAAVLLPLNHENGTLRCGALTLPGKAIARHMKDCDSCLLIAVTLGFAIDRLISTAGQTSPYFALLYDGCASAAIEDLADHATERASALLLDAPYSLTSRFSPGYGDLPLNLQPKLLEALDARRLLGLTVSSSLLLSPIKSVTAIIGVKSGSCSDTSSTRSGCANCTMFGSCIYRKSTTKG